VNHSTHSAVLPHVLVPSRVFGFPVSFRTFRSLLPLFVLSLACLFLLPLSSAHASESFGISSFSTSVSSPQAGAHADFTTSFALNKEALGGPAGQLKNLTMTLPAGLVGDAQDIPKCTTAELTEFDCQPSSQVGVLISHYAFPAKEPGGEPEDFQEQTGIYNVAPSPGHPATLATQIAFATVLIQASVKRDGTYRLEANVSEISTLEPLVSTSVTLWGVPADPSHDAQRFFAPPGQGAGASAGVAPAPFMINSSDCTDGPLDSAIAVESWLGQSASTTTSMQAPIGCGALHAAPALSVTPETTQAGSPSGYDVDISVPQELAPYTLATPDLRDAVVTLPAGTVVSASAANGLQTCSEAQVGWENGRPNGNPVACPGASQVGTVELVTPLLAGPLKGAVYAAAQNANPFGSLLAIYLTAEGEGVQVKLAGHVTTNPVTGQLSTTFSENPKVPASDIKVHLFGGPQAVLSNPTACGAATTTSALTFYSSPTPDEPSRAFNVTGCTPGQFSPSFVAGTTSAQAGGFSPLTVTIARTDADQDISGVQVTMAPGLSAILAGVPRCGEPQASRGECPKASQIGHTVVGAGAGNEPFYLPQAGQENPVYLTTGYRGAPFGLSVVVPAVAGPFNLGTVVVRAAIGVDPHTAQPVISSDPLPQILQGIPVQAKTINVVVDREHFTFNPTNCEPQKVTGVITSAQGATATVQSPFQAANCANLSFKPRLTASTSAHTNRLNGASFRVKISNPSGAEANIAKADLTIPCSLPTRLTTLQKACTEAQFNANPAGCPAASNIATATVRTPLLASPLSGPVYIVSHGGAAFPDVEQVLQGEGVTLIVDGKTQIKKGVTFSHFDTVPDAPFSSFEFVAPKGRFSIFGANGNLCKVKPLLPVTLTGQNGAVIKQSIKITVTGCPKAKKAHKARRSTNDRRAKR
jgi:hypothetical protein